MHEVFNPPIATYRLQFHREFRFTDAAAIAAYLQRLGISHCYSSPYLKAQPGSTHGYDICDHNQLNPEIGSEDDYDRFVQELGRHQLSQILDFVPNHMGNDPGTNPWWRDVLENGRSSAFAHFFDIDWDPLKPELKGKVLLPILGDQYGLVLERGELTLTFSAGALRLCYFEHDLPINPRAAVRVYEYGLGSLQESLGEEDEELREFLSILTALRNLPGNDETEPGRIAERRREKEVARDRLGRLIDRSGPIRAHVTEAVRVFNGTPGVPESFDLLHGMLEDQSYRLANWRTASHEINYRRFFDINGLAALRMEDREVFEATHILLGRLLGQGAVTAVRIDHPDGLFDPPRYFERLQALWQRVRRGEGAGADTAAEAAPGAVSEPLYVLAEKILSPGEALPEDWLIAGTTGYQFANAATGVLVDEAGERPLRQFYTRFTGRSAGPRAFEEEVYQSKKLITSTSLASELNVLAHELNRISESNRRSRDFTLESLRSLLEEVVACFPVYRTYVNQSGWAPADRERLETAVSRARARNSLMPGSLFDFFREVVLPRRQEPGSAEDGERRDGFGPEDRDDYRGRLTFAMRLQQYTSPVQAKGVEDTAFYRYNVLVALNEVGGEPGRFGLSVDEFHAANQARAERWPLELNATATHDTKLGEDVRARIAAISEIPHEWRRQVWRWARINARQRTLVAGAPAPDRNDEYRFYQVLAGAWTTQDETVADSQGRFADRLRDYMRKACKEAKVHTSWTHTNDAYDQAVTTFVERCLTSPRADRFLAAFTEFHARFAEASLGNMLAQLVLKLGAPGIPDIYQGCELWDFHLVDPDNRRAVDFRSRDATLSSHETLFAAREAGRSEEVVRALEEMLTTWRDGRIKLWVTTAALRLRQQKAALFQQGRYVALDTRVTAGAGLLAFARAREDEAVLVVVPRLLSRLGASWREWRQNWGTSHIVLPRDLAGRRYRNVFSGQVVDVEELDGQPGLPAARMLNPCPVAVLASE